MKPLSTASAASQLLERIVNGEGAMLRSLALNGPTTATLTLSVQDKHRGYDWIDISFEMSGMNDAKLVDDKQLDFIDTDEGITVVFEDGQWGLAVGRYAGLEALKSAPLYVIGASLKYAEAPFSG
ncbi:hypothetical protein [Sulfurimonas diazotrophicus]|uniref:Uncharacterized protein n=1 Tax=Sulfurimonas diazotrophicus TaxID=3131939 RepID=A0ABZ3H9L4_9BACT